MTEQKSFFLETRDPVLDYDEKMAKLSPSERYATRCGHHPNSYEFQRAKNEYKRRKAASNGF